MPNTQFSTITLNADHSITAEGPYDPQLASGDWDLVGEPVVIFMVVKADAQGFPDLVANGVGLWKVPGIGQALPDWSGTIQPDNVPGDMQAGDDVRAIGAAIQVKTNKRDRKNPPVVEVVTWCVPQKLSAP
jgi:hypothetical protein